MISRNIAIAGLVIVLQMISFDDAFAWGGQAWGPISRPSVESIANSMFSNAWTPRNTIRNWQYGTYYYTFYRGTYYTGEAYSQNNPQESWSEFNSLVSSTSGGTTYYGNDCSGFVSMCWKLPSRYNTRDFETDAATAGGYVSSLGNIGTAQTILLLKGDALVRSGNHIVLVREKIPSGMKTMEQTPPKALSGKDWTWSQLVNYRPIRRNSMDETLYRGSLSNHGYVFVPNGSYYHSALSGKHSGRLAGPASSDFDLYLYKLNMSNSTWQIVASSYTVYSSESVDYNGSAGYYSWQVRSYNGSGSYLLSVKKP